MNRERNLAGYRAELRLDPLESESWLDLCCGSGRALLEGAELRPDLCIEGLDLVPYFEGRGRFHVAPLRSFVPPQRYDLITCVHGLHYVGDKLGALLRIQSWLNPGGRFVGHLDLDHVLLDGKRLRAQVFGGAYHLRFRLLTLRDDSRVDFGYRFLGADDTVGPNSTGQPAVASYYARA